MTIQRLGRIGGISLVVTIILSALIATWEINQIRFGGEMHLRDQQLNEFNADILPPPEYLLEPFMEANLMALYPEDVDDHSERLEAQEAIWRERAAYWEVSDLNPELKAGLAATVANDGSRFWREINDVLKPAVRAGNEAAARQSLLRLLSVYRDHRGAIDGLVTRTAELQGELAQDSHCLLYTSDAADE